MSSVESLGQGLVSLSDPLLWAAMVLVALRVPLRFMLPAALAVTFAMGVLVWLIQAGDLQTFHFAPWTWVGRALAAWFAGALTRFFIDRSRRAPIVGAPNGLTD